MTKSFLWCGVCAFLLGMTAGIAADASFPFEHELLLDVEPVPGSKRVPSLEVEANGRAAIDLWCASGAAQVAVAGETISIVTGAMTARQCPPERMRSDEELISALAQVTGWRREDHLIVLLGPQTLRFRLSTH
jgi:heat shock protein HslJ